ncbi:MAG: ribokinase [Microvirga sp.]
MIIVFGSINMDLVAQVPAIARPGETVLSRRAETFFGGKGANQAVAASRAASGGPGSVAMAGAVGGDAFGEACRANLRENGVDIGAVRLADEPTGCAFIAVDASGENAITVASGANMAVRAADLTEHDLARASGLVLQLEVPIAESLAVARRAKGLGARIIWNFAPAPDEGDEAFVGQALEVMDVLVVNEHEAVATATLVDGAEPLGYEQAAARLAAGYGLTCIVTAGPLGAVALLPDGERIHVPTAAIVPVDTTGAGDTFVGVLAVELAEGSGLAEAMGRACRAASLSCLKAGAQAGMPTRADIIA